MGATLGPLAGRSILFIIAHRGYRDDELEMPRRILEEAGARVVLASSALSSASGTLGGEAYPDILYSAARVRDFDGLVFVGGSGATEYFPDRTAHRLAQEAVAQGKVLGAICYAGSILAEAGVLTGLKATASPSRRDHLLARGATWTGEEVTRDGRVVTAQGPEAAPAFGRTLVEAFLHDSRRSPA
jgi:protease I